MSHTSTFGNMPELLCNYSKRSGRRTHSNTSRVVVTEETRSTMSFTIGTHDILELRNFGGVRNKKTKMLVPKNTAQYNDDIYNNIIILHIYIHNKIMYLKRGRSLVLNVVQVASVENVTVKSVSVRACVCGRPGRNYFLLNLSPSPPLPRKKKTRANY